ncbi:putative primosome PriB/single-strand DNA-binding, nucleic acid-binding protein [Helianthus annuus]|nr:putative primosome PriB/single-strand DNA-binding, nucleic acid-binding protein [Helianthus annuus]
MNTIRRAITTERNRLLKLTTPSIIQQQHSFSTTGKTKSTIKTLKFSKTRAPELKPPSKTTTASTLNDAVVKEPVTWPKPSEIPWQAKVVNSVNLIGQVKIPVQFEASSDGKSWAGTIVSQDDGSESSGSMTSFWIPVIFEGDLAHIAMCHLKEKDYVHVAGHLSVDVPPFKLSEVQANVQVMAHSIDFVQKSQSKKISTSGELDRGTTKNSGDLAFEEENYAKLRDDSKSSPVRNFKDTRHLQSDHKVDKQSFHASWRDLMTNSKLWVDYREKKSNGLVKPNYPDFKHKDTGAALWLNKAPVGVLQGLGQLEFFGTPNRTPNSTHTSTPNSTPKKGEKGADSWKNLIENPKKWWDNRVDKRNVKGPDFKNKDTGEALWLTDAPSWALSSLPPLATKTVDVNTKKKWAPY